MSRERELLSSIIDMLERSELSGLEYAILDGETVCANDLINAANKELAKPEPEPLGYVHHEMFAGFVKEPGYASMACVKLHYPDSGYTVPVYAEPTARRLLTESSQDRTKKYFSYYPEGGFELHNSAEDAKKSAEDALDTEREYACDGWSEYVDKICWGEVRQHVVETMRRPRTDEDTFISSDFDTIVDYGLVDAANKELEKPVNKREESYSDALRSLASYVGCGGYNADDPIDAKEFEEKIRLGIDLLLSAQSYTMCKKAFY